MTLKLGVYGNSHLAQTLNAAFEIKGFDLSAGEKDIVFVAPDILDHSSAQEVELAHRCFKDAVTNGYAWRIIVVVSQVPPGTLLKWATETTCSSHFVFYQVDTLIVNRALERALNPEQIVIGAFDPSRALPLSYQQFLRAFNCPVLVTDYTSAELAKCAINYTLATQIQVANELSAISKQLGGNYADVEKVLRNDARIGQQAYLKPGQPNQHLNRDVATLNGLKRQAANASNRRAGGFARAAALSPERRKEISRLGNETRWGKP